MATYYVAKSGNNAGSGTAASPWLTINYALRQDLEPGDQVVVRSGTYRESVLVRRDGALDEPIVIRSQEPGGAKIVPPAGKVGININANHVQIVDFDVSGSSNSGITGVNVHHVKSRATSSMTTS